MYVARAIHNGRNFERMSGEDPVLGALMLPNVVQGIQQSVISITVRTNARDAHAHLYTRSRRLILTRSRIGACASAPREHYILNDQVSLLQRRHRARGRGHCRSVSGVKAVNGRCLIPKGSL